MFPSGNMELCNVSEWKHGALQRFRVETWSSAMFPSGNMELCNASEWEHRASAMFPSGNMELCNDELHFTNGGDTMALSRRT